MYVVVFLFIEHFVFVCCGRYRHNNTNSGTSTSTKMHIYILFGKCDVKLNRLPSCLVVDLSKLSDWLEYDVPKRQISCEIIILVCVCSHYIQFHFQAMSFFFSRFSIHLIVIVAVNIYFFSLGFLFSSVQILS